MDSKLVVYSKIKVFLEFLYNQPIHTINLDKQVLNNMWKSVLNMVKDPDLTVIGSCLGAEVLRIIIQKYPRDLNNIITNDGVFLFYTAIGEILLNFRKEKTQTYIYKCHLLYTLIQHELFDLSIFTELLVTCSIVQKYESLFEKLVDMLYKMGSIPENEKLIFPCIIEGLKQLLQSSHIYCSKKVIRAILKPILYQKPLADLIVKNVLKHLKISQYHTFCSIVNKNILKITKSKIFSGEDFQVAEVVILSLEDLLPLQPLAVMVEKQITQTYNQYHKNITQLLVFIIRNFEIHRNGWENIAIRNLFRKMILQFHDAMV